MIRTYDLLVRGLKIKTWTIPGELMKNGQTLTIALTDMEVSILERRLARKMFVVIFICQHSIDCTSLDKHIFGKGSVASLHLLASGISSGLSFFSNTMLGGGTIRTASRIRMRYIGPIFCRQ